MFSLVTWPVLFLVKLDFLDGWLPVTTWLGIGTRDNGLLDGWMVRWTEADWLRRRSTSRNLWYVALPLLFINEFWISWENGRLCRYSCACALLPWFVSGLAATGGTYDDWRPRRRGCCCGRPVVTWWDNLLLHWHLLSVTVSVHSIRLCQRQCSRWLGDHVVNAYWVWESIAVLKFMRSYSALVVKCKKKRNNVLIIVF